MAQCPLCYAQISACDNYCARCGKRLRDDLYLRREESALLKEGEVLFCRVCGKRIQGKLNAETRRKTKVDVLYQRSKEAMRAGRIGEAVRLYNEAWETRRGIDRKIDTT